MRVSNILDSDQARRFVGPDLGPNCLQILSADDTRRQIDVKCNFYAPTRRMLNGHSREHKSYKYAQSKSFLQLDHSNIT